MKRKSSASRSELASVYARCGEHGMVYRYRIVPADFEAKGILPAPSIAGAAK